MLHTLTKLSGLRQFHESDEHEAKWNCRLMYEAACRTVLSRPTPTLV